MLLRSPCKVSNSYEVLNKGHTKRGTNRQTHRGGYRVAPQLEIGTEKHKHDYGKKESDSQVNKLAKDFAVSSEKLTAQQVEIKDLKAKVATLIELENMAMESEEEDSDCEIVSEIKI